MNNTKTTYKIQEQSTTTSYDSTSSDDVANINNYELGNICVQHVNDLSLALSEAEPDYETLMIVYEYLEISRDCHTTFPKAKEAFSEFAKTTCLLSSLNPDERLAYAKSNILSDDVIDNCVSFLHSTGYKGLAFIDPEKGQIFTGSAMLSRFYVKYGDKLKISRSIAASLKNALKYIKKLMSPNTDQEMIDMLAKGAFAFTGAQAFIDAPLSYDKIFRKKKIADGTVKTPAPLAFSVLSNAKTPSKVIQQVVVSKAVQDILGYVPVSFAKSNVCTTSILTYPSISYVREGDDIVSCDATFFAPITIGPEGFHGDACTTDILHDFEIDSSVSGERVPNELLADFEGGKWSSNVRAAVDLAAYDLENDSSYRKYAEHQIWTALSQAKGPVSVNGFPQPFLRFSYSTIDMETFIDKKPIASIMDLANILVLLKNEVKVMRRYAVFCIGSLSQIFLIVRRSKVINDLCLYDLTHVSTSTHPLYIKVWKGMAKTFLISASAFLVAFTTAMHKNHGKHGTRQEVKDFYDKIHSHLPAKRGPSGSRAKKNFELIWRQQTQKPFLIITPAKVGASIANDVIVSLTENDGNYVDVSSSVDDSDDEMITFGYDDHPPNDQNKNVDESTLAGGNPPDVEEDNLSDEIVDSDLQPDDTYSAEYYSAVSESSKEDNWGDES